MLRVLGLILLGRVVVFAESKQEYLESSARLIFFFTQIRYSVAVLNNWLYFKVSLLQTGHQHECVFGIKNLSLMAENSVPVS